MAKYQPEVKPLHGMKVHVIIIALRSDFVLHEFIWNSKQPRLEAVCWTPEEAAKALGKPWWRDALREKVVIVGDYGLFGGQGEP